MFPYSVDAELAAQRIPSDLANDTNLNSLERLFIDRRSTTNSCPVVVIHLKETHNKNVSVIATLSPLLLVFIEIAFET